MMVTLRLYRQHDLDLITLYRHPLFSLPNAIKMSLCAYVRNQKFFIKQPDPYEIGNEKISKIVQIHIQLSEKSEGDVIAWLKNIKDGYRNSVLKNVVRAYMAGPCIYSYIDEGADNFENASNVFDTFESNIRETIEIRGRSYNRQSIKKDDGKKVEDSTLAASILSNNNPAPKKDTSIENIKETKVEELEKITAVKPNIKEEKEEKPKKVETEVKNTDNKKETTNKVEAPVDNIEAENLDDMLDDIDAMMDDF